MDSLHPPSEVLLSSDNDDDDSSSISSAPNPQSLDEDEDDSVEVPMISPSSDVPVIPRKAAELLDDEDDVPRRRQSVKKRMLLQRAMTLPITQSPPSQKLAVRSASANLVMDDAPEDEKPVVESPQTAPLDESYEESDPWDVQPAPTDEWGTSPDKAISVDELESPVLDAIGEMEEPGAIVMEPPRLPSKRLDSPIEILDDLAEIHELSEPRIAFAAEDLNVSMDATSVDASALTRPVANSRSPQVQRRLDRRRKPEEPLAVVVDGVADLSFQAISTAGDSFDWMARQLLPQDQPDCGWLQQIQPTPPRIQQEPSPNGSPAGWWLEKELQSRERVQASPSTPPKPIFPATKPPRASPTGEEKKLSDDDQLPPKHRVVTRVEPSQLRDDKPSTTSDSVASSSRKSVTSRGLEPGSSGSDSVSVLTDPRDDVPTPLRRARTQSSDASTGRVAVDPEPMSGGRLEAPKAIDNDIGIAMGDTMLYLLDDDPDNVWPHRVHEAVWRCRFMRQSADTIWLREKLQRENQPENSPSRGRTSVAVDVDDARVVGGVSRATATQKAAVEHLKYDELDEALELFEAVIVSYYNHIEELMGKSGDKTAASLMIADLKPHIGTALHNLGIVHMLRGEYERATGYLERAVTNRKSCCGEGHADHVSSLVKLGLSRLATGKIPEGKKVLVETIAYSRKMRLSLGGEYQFVELLNNLGCLALEGGQVAEARSYFEEAMQLIPMLSQSALYVGTKFSCHSASLNRSVLEGNIACLSLMMNDSKAGVQFLERAIQSQLFLLRDAHPSLIATMDQLVAAHVDIGNKELALQILQRLHFTQVDTFGPTDPRCLETSRKLEALRDDASVCDDQHSQSKGKKSRSGRRAPSVRKLLKSFKKASK